MATATYIRVCVLSLSLDEQLVDPAVSLLCVREGLGVGEGLGVREELGVGVELGVQYKSVTVVV